MLQVVRRQPWLAFVIAIAAVAAATAFRSLLTPLVGPTALPYIFFFPAVAFVGLVGNLPAALFAIALSALASDLFFLSPPVLSGAGDLGNRIAFGAFIVTNAVIAAMTARLDTLFARETERARLATERTEALEVERNKLERESRRLGLLADVSGIALVNPTFDEVANHAAERVAENIGDGCVIRVLEDGRLRAVALRHAAPDAIPMLEKVLVDAEEAPRDQFYSRLLETRKTFAFAPPARPDLRERVPADLRHVYDKYHARQAAVSAIVSGDSLLGTLLVFRAENVPYSDTDIRALDAVVSRVALALENARLLEKAQGEAEEARRARAAAEEASRVKDEFLATLSHELRTPLNAIVGWAHMLRDPRLTDERRQAAVETIVRNAQSQEQLIADILDVQRIMAGKLRLNLRNADLSDIVRAAAETVQPSAEVKQIRLQLLLDLDVTPIWGDADRLQQVAWNLLSNAIKFTPNGGRVQVRLQRTDAHCEMIVEDNGPGIAPEFIPYVFDRFRQFDSSSTRTHKGLGLGLAIVRSLVEMHGGTIGAANVAEEGRTGAVFTIRLPRNAARIPAAASTDPESAESEAMPTWLTTTPSLEGLRVLVVDDDPDARELIGTILERCGADAVIVGSVEEGMAALGQRAPHVILTDIEMPNEDGYSFIRRIRAMPPDAGGRLPAAALTAYASPADRMKVLSAGFNMHIAKPVQPAELAMIVASLAGNSVADEMRTKN